MALPDSYRDAGIMLGRELAYAVRHKDLPASVSFGIGALEKLAPGRKRSRSEEDADMVAALRDFDGSLRSHRYPNLMTRLRVFEGEDHASVLPLVPTHGLRADLGSSRR